MRKNLPIAIVLAMFAAIGGIVRFTPVHVETKPAVAQSSGGGLYKVTTLDAGTCSGKGSKSSPLDCIILTDIVADTGLITISVLDDAAIAGRFRYARSAGSYITDGFEVGQAITFSGFANAGNNGTKTITTIRGDGSSLETSFSGMVAETGTGDERATGGATITGDGTVGSPFSAEVPLQGATFALFGDGSDHDVVFENKPNFYKNAGADSAWNAGISTVETFAGDGWVQTTAVERSHNRMLGLSYTDPSVDYITLDYAIHFNGGGQVDIYELGVRVGVLVSFFEPGDEWIIRRTGTTITYERNGAVIYTSATPSSGTIRMDLSFYSTLANMINLKMYDAGTEVAPLTWQNSVNLSDVSFNFYIQLYDMYFDNFTIEAGKNWYNYNFRTFVRGTMTVEGTYGMRGNPGTNGADGSTTVADCLAAAGGVELADNSMQAGYRGMASTASSTTQPGCLSGVCGASGATSPENCAASATDLAGATSTGVGNNGSNAPANTCRGGGGASGGGFVGTVSAKGGSPQGLTPVATTNGSIKAWTDVLQGGMRFNNQTRDAGAGGGGAGSCGRDTTNPTLRSPGGGGGGAGSGWLVIFARVIELVGSGELTVVGGIGGNGGSCGTHTGNAGGGGAGGGGGGGTAHIIFGTGTTPTVNVLGGAGGTGGTACAGGSNGGNGGTGSNGKAYIFKAGL